MTSYKQAIVLREDLGMSKGKMIAQACHASLKAYKKADNKIASNWESQGAKKVVLSIGEKDILERFERSKQEGLPACLIKDAGLTEVKPGTITAMGVGPAETDRIDSITGDLRLIE